MRLDVELGAKKRHVEVKLAGGRVQCTIDGRPIEADAVEISPGTYSILIDGRSFDVRVEPGAEGLRVHLDGREYLAKILDPRQWRRSGGAAAEAEGRQQVRAPMPGKVIRVLVQTGDAVEAGQGLFVVEAMKMQNEVRSPKSGAVGQVNVSEGEAVTAGETLCVIE